MKIMTLFGTRPEIIRLSRIIPRLDPACQHVLVHTGQNHDPNLSDIFFDELGVRKPDFHLGVLGKGFADQTAQILSRSSDALENEKPDRLLILGDTNSGLSAIVAARMGIPVIHMEAGNRCYDDRVPEEINRRIIDHSSTVLLPYTHRSMENLVREGIERRRIFVTGNPIFEVLEAYKNEIASSRVLERLEVAEGDFFLVTLHRAENVDAPTRLRAFLTGLSRVADTFGKTMVVSLHPRTADKLSAFNLGPESKRVRFMKPLGFFDFVRLERSAACVLSDSGTVQEECCIFRVPNVTLRDVTERPETIECGSNILTGSDPDRIVQAVSVALHGTPAWNAPEEYKVPNVADTVARIVLGYSDLTCRPATARSS
jgi:UDP-N-acetylglucosamine 2-epimerase (non-hydrolysing)